MHFLSWNVTSLLTAGGLGWMTSKGPLQHKAFYDSMIIFDKFLSFDKLLHLLTEEREKLSIASLLIHGMLSI